MVIRIEGKIVGIHSKGDPRTNLKERVLELVNEYKCDIIFCACRTSGETEKAVIDVSISNNYRLIFSSTYTTGEIGLQDSLNEIKAKHLLSLIQSF